MSQHATAATDRGAPIVDLRGMPPPERHPLVMKTFESLEAGEHLILINDHNPKPLRYEFMYERDGEFEWDDLEQGPVDWRVRIGKT